MHELTHIEDYTDNRNVVENWALVSPNINLKTYQAYEMYIASLPFNFSIGGHNGN